MKKLFLFLITMVSISVSFAQNHKEELVDKIEEKHDWLYA